MQRLRDSLGRDRTGTSAFAPQVKVAGEAFEVLAEQQTRQVVGGDGGRHLVDRQRLSVAGQNFLAGQAAVAGFFRPGPQ